MIVRVTTDCVFTGVYDKERANQSWSIDNQCQDSYTETEGRVSRGLKKDPPPFQPPLGIQPTHETRFMVMDFSSGNEPSLLIAYETLRTKYSQILTPSYDTVAILARAISVEGSVAIGRL